MVDDLESHRAQHTAEAISNRLSSSGGTGYLKDAIYGAVDGAVTTLAVVSSVYGAKLSSGILLILGLANLVADGFSMAVSNFLGTKAERQQVKQARKTEEEHIDVFPEGEKEELRQIFARKGFEGEDLERAVEVVSSDLKVWVDTMLQDELGLPLNFNSPFISAAATFVSFVIIGSIPLLPFLLNTISPGVLASPFEWSLFATGVALFLVGALKSREVGEGWIMSGLETLIIGSIAAALAFGVGYSLKTIAA